MISSAAFASACVEARTRFSMAVPFDADRPTGGRCLILTTIRSVENNRRLGPRPRSPRRPMSPSRLGLLEQLRGQPEPTTLAALVRLSGLHTNTVREHLDALVADGLVRRERALPSGRGRPAWLYETTGEEAATVEYAALASVLAASLAASTEDPARAGTEAGIAWGRRLARDRGAEIGRAHV